MKHPSGELPRVPLVKRTHWIGDEDVSVMVTPPTGRRISMDVAEAVLGQFGARVVEHAIERLGQELPHLYAHEIQRVVDSFLMDRKWAEPIIEQELRRSCREMVQSLWSDDEKKAQRDWFDVFIGKLRSDDPNNP